MCGVDSTDERVQRLVSQISQLASTIEAGNPLESHLTVPCLIVSNIPNVMIRSTHSGLRRPALLLEKRNIAPYFVEKYFHLKRWTLAY